MKKVIAAIVMTIALSPTASMAIGPSPITNPALENRCMTVLTITYLPRNSSVIKVKQFTNLIMSKWGTPCKALKFLNGKKVRF